MFHNRIKRFLTSMGFKDTELREFEIVEGEQESWVVMDTFILSYFPVTNSYMLELIVPLPGTYEDPPCEDYEIIEGYLKTEKELYKAMVSKYAELIMDDISMVEWEEKYLSKEVDDTHD